MIEITMLGVGYFHPLEFTIDRPNGFSEYVFINFLTPVVIKVGDRIEKAPVGSCILYTPDAVQWYRGDGVGLGDNWFYFRIDDGDRLLADCGMPCNRPIAPRHHAPNSRIAALNEEFVHRPPQWREMTDLLVRQMFIELGREPVEPARTGSDREKRIRDSRRQMLTHFDRPWTVGALAAEAGYSQARYATLYRTQFDSTPMRDLLQFRIRHAQQLLSQHSMAIGDVAIACGFGSFSYFCKVFREQVGQTPREYARRYGSPPNQDVCD